jgi:WD40 repeat protein
VRLWDVATGKEFATLLEHSTMVYAVAFSPDGSLLASANGWYWVSSPPLQFGEQGTTQTPIPNNETREPLSNAVVLWNLTRETEQMRWEFEWPIYTVAFSPDGRTLAAGGGNPTRTGSSFGEEAVWLWDVSTGELEASLVEGKFATVWSIAFSPDGKILASGNDDRITLWDVTTGERRASLSRGPIRSVAFSPDGTLLAAGSAYGLVRLWNIATYQEHATLGQHDGIVYALTFSPDGKILASAGQDGNIRLWDVTAEKVVRTIRIPGTLIWSVTFSPDGTLLASGSSDGLIRLWDVGQVLGE